MNIQPTKFLLVATAILVALSSPMSAKDKAAPQLPIGEFNVTFMNGVVENCVFTGDASVKVTQSNRTSTGRAEVSEDKILITYEDDRIEQWSFHDGAYFVNHWHPISARSEGKPSQMGLAEKKLEGAVEVHEWGTFTVLQGSNGKTIRWYQAPEKLVDLPPFVQQQFTPFGKARSPNLFAGLDSVRMETPVLYFYPEKEMDIRVSASFPNGRITEIFPPSSYKLNNPAETLWRGRLLPPDSPEKSKVPAATGPNGRHYAAARAVPDAWLFSQTHLKPKFVPNPKKPAPKPADPIDHFIFYRGAGNADSFPIRAVEQDNPDTFSISNTYYRTIPKLFALRVVEGKSSWTTINHLAQAGYDTKLKKATNIKSFSFPKPGKATQEVAEELRDAMVAALDAEGLTRDEAKAMVATWDDLWFTDPGTRVLAILPQSFADQMVPLHITPKPTKIERVFVARLELINRAQEQVLTTVLDTFNDIDDKAASDQLAALKLGRYSAGGMERAKTLINAKIEQRFARLEKIQKEQKDAKIAATKLDK